MKSTYKADKWYQKAIVVFYRIFMPVLIIFLIFIGPKVFFPTKLEAENNNFIIKIIISLIFCFSYIYVPFFSKEFWYFRFMDLKKTNLVIDPKSKSLSILFIIGRFIALFALTQFALDLYLPLFGRYNFIASGINALLLTIPAVAQFLSVKA